MKSSMFRDKAGSTQSIYRNLALVMPPNYFTRYRLKQIRIAAGVDLSDPEQLGVLRKHLSLSREKQLLGWSQ